MGESTKACLALTIIIGMVTAVFAWFTDDPGAAVWAVRFGAPALAVGALLLILKLHFRKDLVPDELRQVTGTYFNRGGFCFLPMMSEEQGICWFALWYQNQYEGHCVGQVALRPGQGFFLTRSKFSSVSFDVPCGAGEFGVVRIPVPIPREFQGKKQKFEIGAAVRYSGGRGRQLRFHDGIPLQADTNFGSGFRTAVTVLGAATGTIVLSRPATMTVELPMGVAEELPTHAQPAREMLWPPESSMPPES